MSDTKEMNCPACGASMVFDPALQKMKCPFCATTMEVSDYSPGKEAPEPPKKKVKSVRTRTEAKKWEAEETDGMALYTCEACGGEILAEDTLGAAACPFCGSSLVMTSQFSGDLKPEKVIPFQLTKDQAVAAYRKTLKGKPFVPRTFREKKTIDEIKGVYIPYWLFDLDLEGEYVFDGVQLQITRNREETVEKRTHYNVYRKGTVSFAGIPVDGSKTMDDALMEDLEPFDVSKAVPFERSYLSGFWANRYDLTMGKARPRAVERARNSAELAFRRSVEGYDGVHPSSEHAAIAGAKATYVLYPVWLLNIHWQEQDYLFAVNGQTGKVGGSQPDDWRRLVQWVCGNSFLLSLGLICWRILKRLLEG